MREIIVKGVGIIGCIGIIAWLMICRSGLSSKFHQVFFTSKIGVLYGELVSHRSPTCKR